MRMRNGLAADATLSEANGRAEREAALAMARRLGGDKGYGARDFVAGLRELGVTSHVA